MSWLLPLPPPPSPPLFRYRQQVVSLSVSVVELIDGTGATSFLLGTKSLVCSFISALATHDLPEL
jgi:hypothetical protein